MDDKSRMVLVTDGDSSNRRLSLACTRCGLVMDAGQSHDCAQIQLDAIRERLNQIEEVIDHLLLSLPPQERS